MDCYQGRGWHYVCSVITVSISLRGRRGTSRLRVIRGPASGNTCPECGSELTGLRETELFAPGSRCYVCAGSPVFVQARLFLQSQLRSNNRKVCTMISVREKGRG